MSARIGIVCVGVAGLLGVAVASADEHQMSQREMADLMEMDDTAPVGKVIVDQLEWRDGGAGEARAAWDAEAWYGGDYDKVWLKTQGGYVPPQGGYVPEGNRRTVALPSGGSLRDASVDVLWDRVVARWWNLQAGGRQDLGAGMSRTWAAVGIQGLAPQWFEMEATFYLSDESRTAARLKGQYELLLTQRLVLQPYVEANLYGRPDSGRRIGSGLSDIEASLRLRFEVRRELAPYVGVVWLRQFGSTADLVRTAGESASDLQLVCGLRAWL